MMAGLSQPWLQMWIKRGNLGRALGSTIPSVSRLGVAPSSSLTLRRDLTFFFVWSLVGTSRTLWAFDMESPTKEIEEFESTALKYLQPEQIEKIWLRLRGLWVFYLPIFFNKCSCNVFTCTYIWIKLLLFECLFFVFFFKCISNGLMYRYILIYKQDKGKPLASK